MNVLNPFQSRLAAWEASAGDDLWLQDIRTGTTVTFGETARFVERWHQAFRAAGLIPGQRVALSLPNSAGFGVLYVALLTYGATVVPLNPAAPAGELDRIAAKAAVNLVLAASPLATTVPVWVVDPARPGALPVDQPPVRPSPSRDDGTGAVLLYTSGTTGEPKGVRLDAARLAHQASLIAQHHHFVPGDLGYQSLPLFHINGQVVGLLTALMAGTTLAVDDRFHASDFWDVIGQLGPTWINAVPAVLGILANGPEAGVDLSGIRFVRSASAPLPIPVLRTFEARFGLPIVETYGLTEAASQVTANPVAGLRKVGSAGLPVGVRLEVVDPEGRPLPAHVDGEIRIRGRVVVRGYLNSTDRGPFRGGWFYTGDHGHLDSDGYLFLTGRSRELINRGGQKVSPREVEDVLLAHPAVEQAAVIGIPHAVLGEEVAAYVVAPRASASLTAELRAMTESQLSAYKRPVRIVLVNQLPVGPTGKIQRLSLKQQVLAGALGGGS